MCWGGGAEREESMCVYNNLGAFDNKKRTLSSKVIYNQYNDLGAHLLESNMRQILLLDLGNLKDFFHRNLGDDPFRHARPRPRHTRTHTQARVRARTHTHMSARASGPTGTYSVTESPDTQHPLHVVEHPPRRSMHTCTRMYASRSMHVV